MTKEDIDSQHKQEPSGSPEEPEEEVVPPQENEPDQKPQEEEEEEEEGKEGEEGDDEVDTSKDCCNCQGPCVFPQGKKAARAMLIAIAAAVFSISGVGGCNFLSVGEGDGDSWGFLWRKQNSLEGDITNRQLHCTGWSEDEKDVMDARYKVALSFAYLTIATMILLIAPVLALSCATLDATSNRLIAMCFLLAALFQGLTFLSIGSQVCQESFNCKLSFGAGITVGGILLSVLTALALLRVRNWSYYHGHDGDEKGATGEAGGGKEGTGSGHNGEEDLTHENDEEEQQTHGETTEKGGHEGDEESPSVLDAEDVEDVSLGENEDEAHVIVKEATA